MAVDREVIEEQLDKVVGQHLKVVTGKEIIPGWRALFMLGVELRELGKKPDGQPVVVPRMQDRQMDDLLRLAETWPDAFDAAGYTAGMSLAAGLALAPKLSLFAAKVLAGERKRPKQRGRPLSDGKLKALYQIALVRFLHEKADLPVARNRENSVEASFNACQAVAEAFTRAGQRTTFDQVASLIYDAPHQALREMAKSIGMLDFNRSEPN
jgi:hypothetical protein